MKDLNYWDSFMNSGRIEDYLYYKSAEDETSFQKKNDKQEKEKLGGNPYAGLCDGHGYGSESGTYRGI